MDLKANDTMTLGATLTNSTFRLSIPLNQRKYEWKENEEIEAFWNDFKKLMEGEDHYFGVLSFVITDDTNNPNRPPKSLLEVMDGQQRILTTSLLIAALRDLYIAANEIDQAKRIHKTYFITQWIVNMSETMSVSRLDQHTFKELVNVHTIRQSNFELNIDPDIKLEYDEGRKIKNTNGAFINKNMKNAYSFFYNTILKGYLAKNTPEEKATYLIDLEISLNRMNVIWITSEDPDFLYLFFETLNNRGLQLNQMDIIRNKLLSIVAKFVDKELVNEQFINFSSRDKHSYKNQVINEVSELWDDLVIMLNDLEVSRFLKYYYMCTEEKILNSGQLPSNYEKLFEKKENIDGLKTEIRKMIEFGSLFAYFYNTDEISTNTTSSEINITNINSLKQQACYSFLMAYYYNVLDENRRENITKLLENFMFKRIVVNAGTRDLDGIFRAMISNRTDKEGEERYDDTKLEQYLKDISPSQESISYEFTKRVWERNDVTNYVLRMYESLITSHTSEYHRIIKSRKEVHIEHIAPVSPTEEWLKQFSVNKNEYREIVNRLGNLVLLKRELNQTSQQLPFDQKRDNHYIHSELEQVKSLMNITDWTQDIIDERTLTIYNTCKDTWKI